MPDAKHYLYRLRLVNPLKLAPGFSEAELATLQRHRDYLGRLTAAGTLVLAGRTAAEEATFGVVIFSAADVGSARTIMEADPAVAEGLMTAELFPFILTFHALNPETAL